MNYAYIIVLAVLLPFILVLLGVSVHIVWFMCFYVYRNTVIIFPITILFSGILWLKKKKFLSIITTILIIDIITAGFIVYELSWAIVSEY